MKGRARLYVRYFVSGEGDAARPTLGGVLATIIPADKKIIHGMTDAILAPAVQCKFSATCGMDFQRSPGLRGNLANGSRALLGIAPWSARMEQWARETPTCRWRKSDRPGRRRRR